MIDLSTRTTLILTILVLIYAGSRTWAADQEATFTEIQGNVTLFTHPSKTIPEAATAPRALYEGEYYLVEPAKMGSPVQNGNIVRTAPGAKARLIYPNGDQINIGSATAYRTFWKGETKPEWNLAYGKIRAIVEKGGPRAGLKVRTRSAVMGVRGTDFFIAERPDSGTEVSIIRGEVELKTNSAEAQKKAPTLVKSGFSAEVLNPSTQTPETTEAHRTTAATQTVTPKVELRHITQEELIGIQKLSNIVHTAETQRNPQNTEGKPTELSRKITALEDKATQTTLKDIRLHQKDLFVTLEQPKKLSLNELNHASIENMMKDAPKAPAKRKPYSSEIEELDDAAYDRYFKKL